MNQTILAALALLTGTIVAVQRYVAIGQGNAEMVRSEVEMQAVSVAKDRLEEIGAYEFDEATTGGRSAASAADLTPAAALGQEVNSDDLDDFHNASIRQGRQADVDSVWFRVRTAVAYASELDPSATVASPTKVKKVTVVVRSDDGLLPDSVVVSQSFACGSACTW